MFFLKFYSRERGVHVVRNYIVLFLLFAGFVAVLIQAFRYQVISGDYFRQKVWGKVLSEHQYTKRRGNIYDRTGERLFASTVSVKSFVYRGVPLTETRKEIAYSLAEALNLPVNEMLLKVLPDTNFEYIKSDISNIEENLITKLNLPGITVEKEMRRFNPAGGLLIQTLGIVNIDSRGMSGIEKFYDEFLLQGEYSINYLKDSKKRKIYTGGLPDTSELTGYDLVLTVDMEIQNIVEGELEKALVEHGAKSAIGIVLDPRTFEILAIANIPTFPPNEVEKYCGKKPYLLNGLNLCKNRAVYDLFEQGSIMKIFTVAAALESGAVNEKTLVFAGNGSCRIGKYLIEDIKPLEWVSPSEVIKYSSNCGAIEIAVKTGSSNLYRVLKDFGFGEKTGVDLPDEVSGSISPPSQWKQERLKTIAYGYGVSQTPLQMAVAFATVANKGVRMKPYIVKRIVDGAGKTVKEFQPQVIKRVVFEKTVQTVKEMMAEVVEKEGTGWRAAVNGFKSAGKSGTAKMLGKNGYEERYVSLFAGFVPLDDPKLAIYIAIFEPSKEFYYGGIVAAPVFKAIAEKTLSYMEIYGDVISKGL